MLKTKSHGKKGEGMATITVSPIHFEDYSGIQFALSLRTMCALAGVT
ncbi:hypothetical protein [Xanthomonas euvesicatoria]|nr:hypothetical protein [Xanthomonas euvesicatoria]MBV6848737.1 hypothetical protein [Xanthomonas campestris pv. heliotropii]